MRYLLLLAVLPAFVSCAGLSTEPFSSEKPAMIKGTYMAGSNVTEPRPRSSRYLQTEHGGFVVIGQKAGHYLQARVREAPRKTLFIRAYYEAGNGQTLSTSGKFTPDAKGFVFSPPDFVTGIRCYQDYSIRVEITESESSRQPIDTLVQPVRSYIDTTSGTVRLFSKMKPR